MRCLSPTAPKTSGSPSRPYPEHEVIAAASAQHVKGARQSQHARHRLGPRDGAMIPEAPLN